CAKYCGAIYCYETGFDSW
nr:immunoglobulin heavy chain junction region [Macaca mulatta]MOW33647.1 immunoglobulin heavy chain junction region [Macaca mulatta]